MGGRTTSDLVSTSSSDRLYRAYETVGFLPIVLVVLVVILALFVPHFLALQNIFNVLRSSSYSGHHGRRTDVGSHRRRI